MIELRGCDERLWGVGMEVGVVPARAGTSQGRVGSAKTPTGPLKSLFNDRDRGIRFEYRLCSQPSSSAQAR
jgi:hypothetical protein